MTPLPWYLTALAAAVVWGIHYPLLDHALKRISLPTVLLLTALPIVLIGAFFHRQIAQDWLVVRALPTMEQVAIAAIMLTSSSASVLLFLSIGAKNATLASLIEITYPLFVALFAYLLFREVTLSLPILFGAALIFFGAGVIIFSTR